MAAGGRGPGQRSGGGRLRVSARARHSRSTQRAVPGLQDGACPRDGRTGDGRACLCVEGVPCHSWLSSRGSERSASERARGTGRGTRSRSVHFDFLYVIQ